MLINSQWHFCKVDDGESLGAYLRGDCELLVR